jgi:hypothetical protein
LQRPVDPTGQLSNLSAHVFALLLLRHQPAEVTARSPGGLLRVSDGPATVVVHQARSALTSRRMIGPVLSRSVATDGAHQRSWNEQELAESDQARA